MQIEKSIFLDFSSISNLDELYDELALQFGFPDFFGRNIDAVIDCIFGVRYPDEGMTKINISGSGCLSLNIRNFSSADVKLKDSVIYIVEFVNYKYQFKGLEPAILLCLVK
ncbi:barstar family protein [Pectobacterium parmentieri]|uniref:barstar family protein n=1 Tax=Pectobacterium parmentieri TaxID=1905730 RepID=UPI000EB2DFD5|nr:barstar family protein [Pectobacterium parmentieri]AYG99818.1 barnase inhibitor [Pectobacterium parmentieri]AYH26056.1 barnase inhibitor [Pectobacterium parmentieri]AYH30510.1 barnase inhibitor [Pectobacterium parmentieri]MBI0520942.1 barstar family protein [Pectobacterium parmentieri]QHQ17386.1 barnase inhibitor [Pectobacterium parmentieri]